MPLGVKTPDLALKYDAEFYIVRFAYDLSHAMDQRHLVASARNLSIACMALSAAMHEEPAMLGYNRFSEETAAIGRPTHLEASEWVKQTHECGARITPGQGGWVNIMSGLNMGDMWYKDIGPLRTPDGLEL
jgi:hypothetical protein